MYHHIMDERLCIAYCATEFRVSGLAIYVFTTKALNKYIRQNIRNWGTEIVYCAKTHYFAPTEMDMPHKGQV